MFYESFCDFFLFLSLIFDSLIYMGKNVKLQIKKKSGKITLQSYSFTGLII